LIDRIHHSRHRKLSLRTKKGNSSKWIRNSTFGAWVSESNLTWNMLPRLITGLWLNQG
jgi:hypothetical protein